jgi:hypothetical protein
MRVFRCTTIDLFTCADEGRLEMLALRSLNVDGCSSFELAGQHPPRAVVDTRLCESTARRERDEQHDHEATELRLSRCTSLKVKADAAAPLQRGRTMPVNEVLTSARMNACGVT